jgi:ribosomal protein S18 acetylase RimI-like enzyme
MRPDLAVREATTDDVGAIRRVARKAWRETYGFIDEETVEGMLAQGYSTEFLEAAIGSPELTLFVAEADGEVIGYVSCEPPDADGVGQVSIHVSPDYWGEGTGTALLERSEAYLREEGATAVQDTVLANNEVGNAFYAWHLERVDETTVELGGEEYDANIYRGDL